MPAIPGTTKISLPLAPNDSVDTYPITNPTYGLGGLRTVANVTDRDAIVQPRREQGMVVYVQDIQKFYTMVGSTGNTAWTEVISNGASAASVVSSFNGLTGAVSYSPQLATSTLTGVASFGNQFVVSAAGAVGLTTNYVISVNGRTGNVGLPVASTSVTGVAYFKESHFNVDSEGYVELTAAYSVTGDTVVQGSGISVSRNGNAVTISSSAVVTVSIATNSITGVAAFTGNDFSVSPSGVVSLTGGIVRSFNGLTGAVVYTPPLASSTATGSASFNATHFAIGNTGHVSLASVYQVTGDTVVAGTNVGVSRSGNTVTVSSTHPIASASATGVASFGNEFVVSAAGAVSLTANYVRSFNGFTGAVVYAPPLATTSVTGVASFNSTFFTVSTGAVSLASGYQVTGDTVSQGTGIIVSRSGNSVTVTSNPRLATTSLTGEASFNDTHFAIGNTGHVSLASAYRVTGDTVVAGTNIGVARSGNTVTVSSTHPIATSSVTGVASFNSSFFTVSSGAVSLASAYQVTGDTVSQGSGIIVSRSGNNVTITSNPRLATTSLTGEASFNDTHFAIGNTGHVSLAPAYRVTGDTVVAGTNVGVARSGNTVTVSSTHPIATSSITGVASFSNQFVVSAAGAVSLTANIVTAVNGRTGNVGLPLATTTGITGVAWFNPTDFNVGSTGRVALTTKAFQAVLPGVDDSPSYLYMPSALQSNKVRLTSDESYGATTVSEILSTQIATTSTTTRLLLAGAVSGEIIFNTSGSSAQAMSLPTYYPVADVTVVAMTDYDAVPVSYCTSKFMIVKNESGGTEFTEYANICSGTQLGTYAIQATGPESYWGLVVTPTSANKTFFSINATRFKRPYSALN